MKSFLSKVFILCILVLNKGYAQTPGTQNFMFYSPPAFITIFGVDNDDRSGWSVSAAGDVNGDGFDDVVIISPKAAPNGTNSATSYVVFGRSSKASVQLSNIETDTGAHGFAIHGVDADDQNLFGTFHSTVSAAGDVNGDGLDDLIIGAPGADPGGRASAGTSYVVFGRTATTPVDLEDIEIDTGGHGFAINGASIYDYSGHSVSGAGDINGDGYDDIVVGAPRATPNGNHSGSSYVVFGKPTTGAINLSNIETNTGGYGFVLNGGVQYDENGRSVSSAGDVNGDGLDDVIVNSLFADPSGSESGANYVVFGRTATTPLNLSNIDNNTGGHGFVINGANAGDRSGLSVSGAGDVNNDGLDDLIVGAYLADPEGRAEAGTSYVVFGKTTTTAVELSNIESNTGGHGFAIYGASDIDLSGSSVSSAGDVNGDGFDDVIVGAYLADPNGKDMAGTGYVVFGRTATTPINVSDIEANTGGHGFAINGSNAGNRSGISVSSAGDFNNDGIDDIIMGAYLADPEGRTNAGITYVVFGRRGSTAAVQLSY